MEAVLEVYRRRYDPFFPVVCMDESPKSLLMNVQEPLPTKPGAVAKVDHEYIRCGVAEIFLAVEPLVGRWTVSVTEKRTKIDWAHFIKHLVDVVYPKAKKITIVLDNLNTHKISSLYEAFPAEEALRIASKIQLVYTLLCAYAHKGVYAR